MSTLATANPATGAPLAEYATFSDADVDAALDRAAGAQHAWGALPVEERGVVLRRVAATLRQEVEEPALLITRETGEPPARAASTPRRCSPTCAPACRRTTRRSSARWPR